MEGKGGGWRELTFALKMTCPRHGEPHSLPTPRYNRLALRLLILDNLLHNTNHYASSFFF